jgi:hypothetical protein
MGASAVSWGGLGIGSSNTWEFREETEVVAQRRITELIIPTIQEMQYMEIEGVG